MAPLNLFSSSSLWKFHYLGFSHMFRLAAKAVSKFKANLVHKILTNEVNFLF